MTIGKRLKLIRTEKGLTVKEIAEILDIPTRTIGAYERDENPPNTKLLVSLIEKFNIDINWFLTGEGSMHGSFDSDKFFEENFDISKENADKLANMLSNKNMQNLILKLFEAKNGDMNSIDFILQTLNGMKIAFSKFT